MQNWLSEKIEHWPLKKLRPNKRNSRLHSSGQIADLCKMIQEFGFTNPILVQKNGEIIAGHARLQAAKVLKLGKIPVIVLDHLSERQVRALVIADNQSALQSTWDFEMLGKEIDYLVETDFDIDLIGFDEQEIEAILKQDFNALPDSWDQKEYEVAAHKRKAPTKQGKIGDDELPGPPKTPVTKTGDVWILGRHRLACGDSRKPETYQAATDGGSPNLMITDPPYGVQLDPAWREKRLADSKGKRKVKKIENDNVTQWGEAYSHFKGPVAYVWHGGVYSGEVGEDLETAVFPTDSTKDLKLAGFKIRAQIIWAKQHFVLSQGHYHWQHETAFYAVREGGKADWIGDRKQSTVWQISNSNFIGGNPEGAQTPHSTQKPVECMLKPMLNHSGDVYDPFGGSGTTLIAAEKADRRCYMAEISPEWCDLIVRRWQDFTGLEAFRECDSEKYNSLENE